MKTSIFGRSFLFIYIFLTVLFLGHAVYVLNFAGKFDPATLANETSIKEMMDRNSKDEVEILVLEANRACLGLLRECTSLTVVSLGMGTLNLVAVVVMLGELRRK